MRDRLAERGFSGRVPVFPLPETVLFPGVLMPLHIFEPRYRTMLADAIAGEGLIAIATLLPGWENDEGGAPKFHPLATVGELRQVERLPDGRSNITLHGLERVRLEEEYTDLPYRSAFARVVPDTESPDETDPEIRDAKERLLAAFGYLLQLVNGPAPPAALVTTGMSFEAAVHGICQSLDMPLAERLTALEAAGPSERLPLAREWLGRCLDAALEQRGLPRLEVTASETN